MLIAAKSDAPVFAAFVLYNLIGTAVPGAMRAGLLVPAMIHMRTDAHALVPARYAAMASGTIFVAALSLSVVIETGITSHGAVFAFASGFGAVSEWLRFRWLAVDARWRVAVGDLARIPTLFAFAFLSFQSGAAAQTTLMLVALPGTIFWAIGLRPAVNATKFRLYRGSAGAQAAEFGVSQLSTVAPMLLIGALQDSALVVAVRFAQTLFGPLNVISATAATSLLTNGATRKDLKANRSLITHGKHLSLRLALFAAILTFAGTFFARHSTWLPPGVNGEILVVAIVLVGAQATSNAWTGMHNVLVRFLGGHRQVAVGRAIVVGSSTLAYALGFLIGGGDLSLVSGMLTVAVIGLLAFGLPARTTYRRWQT